MNMINVYVANGQSCKYAIDMSRKILAWFEENHVQIISDKPLVLHFDETLDCPIFLPSENTGCPFDCIHINLKDDIKWNQLLFQLSHELCHYVIYLNNKQDYQIIKWIEESICEAFSLFCLKKWSVEWKVIGYPSINKNYGKLMSSYRKTQMQKDPIHPSLMDDIDMKILINIDDSSESNRLRRQDFVCQLTNLISKQSISKLIDYQNYRYSNLLLNTKQYDDLNNNAVHFICEIQNKIRKDV